MFQYGMNHFILILIIFQAASNEKHTTGNEQWFKQKMPSTDFTSKLFDDDDDDVSFKYDLVLDFAWGMVWIVKT